MSREDGGAAYGQATHIFLRHLDYAVADSLQALTQQRADMLRRQLLTADQALSLDLSRIHTFAISPLADRLRRRPELVQRELVFTLRAPRRQLGLDGSSLALVQGVMDLVYGPEDGEVLLIDFKTDHVSAGELPLRAEAYRRQIEVYKLALAATYPTSRIRAYLYFFAVSQAMEL